MKTQFLAFLVLLCFGATSLQAQEKHPSVVYMEQISSEYQVISEKTWDYLSTAANSKRLRKIEKKRKQLVKSIQSARSNVTKLPAYEGDKSYRDAAVKFLKINEQVIDEDFAKLMDMEEVSEQSYDAMEAYLLAKDIANQKLQDAADELNVVEKQFAENNGITLNETESEIGKKIKAAGEVFGYHRGIYLIFFKAYKQEAYLLAAMQANDLAAIEQNKVALIAAAEEGLAKLDTMRAFKNNRQLIQTCQKVLNFYIKEANSDVVMLSEFLLEKEKFDKAQKALEAKKNRTQEDVDEFNKKVEVINKASQDLNNQMGKSNNERGQLIDLWNDSVFQFTSRYIPNK
jgi:hypothetical protein